MRFFKNSCLVLLIFMVLNINAQENKTQKTGLCLSGGGAKGLAHIGLLKLIDSLGIKIDYITGTSMGSVVGGLYAAGYTGLQIDSIAHTSDWELLLNQYVPMNDIYIDEKDEYGRYLGEIPIKKKRMEITGFIEGQELLNTLMRLTKHVNQIIDFNKLPIPFKCMATDIVNVKPVVIDHGSLAIAMRASMSIPTVFKPIRVDGKLMVDGGVMVNFPVHQLKEMGADFIIGSYTGGRLMEENELNTINKLLMQTSSFYGINKSKDDIALCDIFSNLTDSMKQYGPGEFKISNRIIETGNIMSHAILPQLLKLADKQRASGAAYRRKKLVQQKTFFKVEDIVIEPACNAKAAQFIMNRVTFKTGDSIQFCDLEKTVKKIYGTRNYFKVYYILEPQTNGNYIVKIKAEPDVAFRFKGAMHYDTDAGAGFILNLTARNWLGDCSRLTGTLDLSQEAKYRIQYRKYIAQSNFSFNAQYYGERSALQWEDSQGKIDASSSFNDFFQSFNMGINYNIAVPSSLYIGVTSDIDRLRPRFTPVINVFKPGDNTQLEKQMTSHTSVLTGQFRFNNLNRFVFPNKGTEIFMESRLILVPTSKDELSIISMDSAYVQHEQFSSTTTLFAPYNKINLKVTNLLPINSRVSVVSNFTMGLTYFNAVKIDTSKFRTGHSVYTDNDTPVNDYFFIGGVEGESRQNFSSLWGQNTGENIQNNFAAMRLGIQCEVLHKLFITPAIAYLYTATTPKHFLKYIGRPNTNGAEYYPITNSTDYGYGFVFTMPDYNYIYTALITYGINIGYKSPIGPINFNISKPSSDKHWRAYVSLGYRF